MKVLSSDTLRGKLETFILKALLNNERIYGAEISKRIKERSNNMYIPNEQSMYSALHRLEEQGLIRGSWGDEIVGVTRKYYTITELGKKCYEANLQEWNNSKVLIDILI